MLIVLIVAYFVIQVLSGVSIDNPTGRDLLRFGANFLPMSIIEPWRLITAGFVHIGIMHLLFNTFALYYFGQVAEMMLGKWRFASLFILSVIGGNVLGLYENFYRFVATGDSVNIAAGASGGIMGIGAALIALSFSRHAYAKQLNKKGLLMVMAINLIMGFAIANIDNAGHIGGAVVGFILGLVFGFIPRLSLLGVLLVAGTLGAAFWLLLVQVVPYL